MRIWVDFFFFWVTFIFYFFLFYIYIWVFLDIFYMIEGSTEDEDDEFIEIISEYGVDSPIFSEISEENPRFNARFLDENFENISMRRMIDTFNRNYVFPTYNYFYPCKDPEYSFFFDSKYGKAVAIAEYIVEATGEFLLFNINLGTYAVTYIIDLSTRIFR